MRKLTKGIGDRVVVSFITDHIRDSKKWISTLHCVYILANVAVKTMFFFKIKRILSLKSQPH